ncbi:MAG TPA: hypothetical protein VE621_02720 [Bryobacteraceae bacterium]|nr:hypothetical protein [Bryobacteraceae bacterium]
MLSRIAIVCLAPLSFVFADTIDGLGFKWTVPVGSEWSIEQDQAPTLHVLKERPQREPRRPIQFALAETSDYRKLTLECEVKRIGGSLILVYAYQDPTHFNYAHLSVDTGKKQPVHNGIFHVFGGERVRISTLDGPAALPSDQEWYRVRLDWDGDTGLVTVKVNGQELPSLRGVDLSLTHGKFGLGSFFDRAKFRNLRVTGKTTSSNGL